MIDVLNFQIKAHAGFFQVGPKLAVDEPHGRKILNPGKTHGLEFLEQQVTDYGQISSTDADQKECLVNYGQHFVAQFLDDLIGIAVRINWRQPSESLSYGSSPAPRRAVWAQPAVECAMDGFRS